MQAIKSYSPELIVHGCLKEQQPEAEAREAQVEALPQRLHTHLRLCPALPLARGALGLRVRRSLHARAHACGPYMHVYMHAHEVNARWKRSVSGFPRYPRWSWGRDSDAMRRCRRVLQRQPACTPDANLDPLTPSPTRGVSCPVCVPCMVSCS